MIKNVYMGCIESTSCSDSILMKLEFSQNIFEKYWSSSSGSRVVLREWTEGLTDMTNLIVAYRNSANAPKKEKLKEWDSKETPPSSSSRERHALLERSH
jgi:hypothetical protein